MLPQGIPGFSELPLRRDDPPRSAWGLYGPEDELGTLNRLTDEVVLEAAKEIKTGQRVSLNWELDAQCEIPFFGRQVFEQKMYQKPPRTVNDDTWSFNTQSSSQWDGLRHFGYQKEKKFYNGKTTDDFYGEKSSKVNGVQAWAKAGIVGRGVLLDYYSWAQKRGLPITPFETTSISLEHLIQVAAEQGTEFKFGDILITRTGFIFEFKKLSQDEIMKQSKVVPPCLAGVEQSEEVLEWIWNNFSAVAGDQPSFECWPTQRDFVMHETLLAGYGCPIGELFDLEALSEKCRELNRWEFFITSEPCNVPGGVASPPNILAIF